MSAVSLPVSRPTGRALLVGNPASRSQPAAMLALLGYGCDEADDPYTAVANVFHRPNEFDALILSLSSVYREELLMIGTLKRAFPRLDIWLTQTDGRHAAMAEALRLGADGLLSDDGLHRIGLPTPTRSESNGPISTICNLTSSNGHPQHGNGDAHSGGSNAMTCDYDTEMAAGEPVLTADELRALLQEQPMMPPRGEDM